MPTRVRVTGAADAVLIALGGNLPSAAGVPRRTLAAALDALADRGVATVARSRWYRSAPVPPSGQPWFVNGVAAVETTLGPEALLAEMLAIEGRFGRVREARWMARTLDLDLLDYRGVLRDGDVPPTLPHPQMHERAFVLLPLAEVAPTWRHPRLGLTVAQLIARLPPGQQTEPDS